MFLKLPTQVWFWPRLEFETADEYQRFQMPDFALADVTTDTFFTGGAFATAPESILRRVLDERLRRG